jgi:hypothetical protein
VKWVVEVAARGEPVDVPQRPTGPKNTNAYAAWWSERARHRLADLAKALFPRAQAAGYRGSAQNLRRSVAAVKADPPIHRRLRRHRGCAVWRLQGGYSHSVDAYVEAEATYRSVASGVLPGPPSPLGPSVPMG